MSSSLCLPTHQPFDNGQWRSLINNICKQLDCNGISLDAISPFGFELLGDKRFLNKNLKRFYCYIGIPEKNNVTKEDDLILLNHFSDVLFDKIKSHYPRMFESFILKIHQDTFIKLRADNYQPTALDKLIDIQVRHVNHSILDDYADYIITTLSALHHDKDEAKFFMHNTRFRSRTFQLYVMQECLFNEFLPPLTVNEEKLYMLIFSKIRNSVDIFYQNEKLNVMADDEDIEILNGLMRPRIQLMIDEAKNHSDVFILKTESYHVPDNLQIEIGLMLYEKIKGKIIDSYLRYQ